MAAAPGEPATLPALLAARGRAWGAREAACEKRRGIWRSWTWAGLAAAVEGCAAALHARGFRPGDRLVVMGEASVAWLVADLAAQHLGGASVTPYPDAPRGELAEALAQAPARFAAVDGMDAAAGVAAATGLDPDGFILLRPEAGCPGTPLEALLQAHAGHRAPPAAADPDAVATVAFTPGAGGRCRATPLTHATLLRKAGAVAALAGARAGGVHALVQVPLAHPAERVAGPGAHLVAGGTLFFAERIDTVGADIAEARPALLSALPWQWEALRRSLTARLAGSAAPLRGLWARRLAGASGGIAGRLLAGALRRHLGLGATRLALSHGAALAPDDAAFLRALGLGTLEGYGVTETAGWSLARRDGAAWQGVAGAAATAGAGGELLLSDAGATVATGDRLGADGGPGGPMRVPHAPEAEAMERSVEALALVRRAFVSEDVATVEIDMEAAGAFARRAGLAWTTYRSLAGLPELTAELRRDVARATGGRCTAFILAEPVSRGEGGLTAAGTVRRSAVPGWRGDGQDGRHGRAVSG